MLILVCVVCAFLSNGDSVLVNFFGCYRRQCQRRVSRTLGDNAAVAGISCGRSIATVINSIATVSGAASSRRHPPLQFFYHIPRFHCRNIMQ